MEYQNYDNILLIFIFWIFAIFYNRNQFRSKVTRDPGVSYTQFFFVILFFCICDFAGGDWVQYHNTINKYFIYKNEIHFEPIYFRFADLSNGNFFIWRLWVWGLSCLFLIYTIKRLDLSPAFTCLLLLIIYFQYFVGARQSLAFCLLYYGLSYIIKPITNNKLLSYLIFILFSILAFLCHKSAIIYIVIAFFSIQLKLNKKTISLAILIFPVLYASIFLIGDYIISLGLLGEDIAKSGNNYLNSNDVEKINSNGVIQRIINWTPIIMVYLYITYHILKNKFSVSGKYSILFNIAFTLFYISWLFRGQPTSKFLAPRFMDASLFPLLIFCSYYLSDKRSSRWIQLSLWLFVLSDIYRWLYYLYKV